MKPFARKFYNSKAWKKCRESYIISVHGMCERCNSPGYIVHHIEYLTPENINDPNVTLNHDKLEYVCQDCHNKEHHGDSEPIAEGLIFDEDGNLISKSI
jgi:5-methylcytosine-specific restriction protein A